jgi:hypothetical protein
MLACGPPGLEANRGPRPRRCVIPAPDDSYALRHKYCPGCGIFFNVVDLGAAEPIIEAAPGI